MNHKDQLPVVVRQVDKYLYTFEENLGDSTVISTPMPAVDLKKHIDNILNFGHHPHESITMSIIWVECDNICSVRYCSKHQSSGSIFICDGGDYRVSEIMCTRHTLNAYYWMRKATMSAKSFIKPFTRGE
jgi:hypothetical protein